MKFNFVLALLVASSVEAVQHRHRHRSYHKARGIDEKELMEGAHWRKPWPEGAVDATGAKDDSEDFKIIDEYNVPLPKKPVKPPAPAHHWYEYEPHTTTMAD